MVKKLAKKSESDDIEDLIRDIGEDVSGTTALIYGKSGTGKTAFGSTWPKPILLLDIQEEGTETVIGVEQMKRIKIDSWGRFEKTYWYLKQKKRPFATIMLDQITQLQDVAINSLRQDNNKEDEDLITKRMWGQVSGKMKTWLLNYRDLRALGYNVLFIAHERFIGGDDDGEDDQIDPSIGARMMPSVSSFVNGAVSVIGNTFIREVAANKQKKKPREVHYCMRLGPHAYYNTKIRTPIRKKIEVPSFITNPTFEKVMRISRGEAVSTKPIKVKR
jgi:hypothetical protein